MKRISIFVLILFWAINNLAQNASETATPFLPELFSQFPNVRDIALSPSGDEVYFTVQSYVEGSSSIAYSQKVNGKWSEAKMAAFSGRFNDLEPFFYLDGLRLYFVSNRAVDDKSLEIKDYDIWYVERKSIKEDWSDPINLGAPVNSVGNEFYPSLSKNGNLYFTSDNLPSLSKGRDDIFMSAFVSGKYTSPVLLSDSINTTEYEFNAFVAADESYLIYTGYNRAGGVGSGDLYISFKNKKGEWTSSLNLSKEINSDKMDYCPFVDEKNETLYFTSKRNSVKTIFEKQYSLIELLKEMNKYENGLSRIYTVDISSLLKR
ncbi:MAG: PD40 domain-containing protein [Bacteroidetes bacterium]|nr:PD40 domain-containing protein [Bacteroidota bacterium]